MAKELDDDIVLHIKGLKALPMAFFVQNKYLTGIGAEKKYRLTVEFAKTAVDLAYEKLLTGARTCDWILYTCVLRCCWLLF